jgi:outer membrane protein OmpA-like peptidoglycan-associated protein
VVFPLTAPQSQRFGLGAGASLKALVGLTPYLDVGPSVSYTHLSASEPFTDSGTAWGFGAGLRLKRPHDAVSLHGISPWLDADALYLRTGELNRAGFDAAVGLAVPIGEARRFWVGPFVRYLQTFQGERVGFDTRDAKLLTVGISLEVGSGIERKHATGSAAPAAAATTTAAPEAASSADRDGDSVLDSADRCPDVAGRADNGGCPNYEKVVIKPDKLELKEKLHFALNEARLEEASLPVLDEVAQALKDNPGFRVQVEGHADSSGPDAQNQVLSEQRAEAVLNYLASHGIAKDRLGSKGFSSSVPTDTNTTTAGRENNRRVEFVVSFIILNSGSAN